MNIRLDLLKQIRAKHFKTCLLSTTNQFRTSHLTSTHNSLRFYNLNFLEVQIKLPLQPQFLLSLLCMLYILTHKFQKHNINHFQNLPQTLETLKARLEHNNIFEELLL
jgi:hypothetical protein